MAVVLTQEIRKKRTLLAVVTILLITTAVILYFGLRSTAPPETISGPSGASGETNTEVAPAPDLIDLKVDILNDDRFKKLQQPPGVPVATSTTGKLNPFSE